MECQRSRGRLTRHLILAGAEAKNSILRALCLSCDMQVNISHRLAWIMLSGKGSSSHKSFHLSISVVVLRSQRRTSLGSTEFFNGIEQCIPSVLFGGRYEAVGSVSVGPGIVLKYLIIPFLPVGNTVGSFFFFFFNPCSVAFKLVNASRGAFFRQRVPVKYLFIYIALKHSVTYVLPGFWLSLHAF